MKKINSSDNSFSRIQRLYRIVIASKFAIAIFASLILLAGIIVLMFLLPQYALVFSLLLVFVLIVPLVLHLVYYAKKVEPEKKQLLIGIFWPSLFFVAGIFWLSVGLAGKAEFSGGFWIIILSLFFIGLFLLWITLSKKASWIGTSTASKGTFKAAYFEKTVSKKYSKNLLVNEIVMLIIAAVGGILKYVFSFDTFGSIFMFIGIGGMLLAPIWCGFILPPKFFSKNQAELKGILSKNEKFLGAVYGVSLPSRPKAAIEETDNSLFVTNNHLFCITIPGLKFAEQTDPLYKTRKFDYLKKKGNELLRKTPKQVLFSHDFNFSLDFGEIEKIKMVTNLLFKLAGVNLVIIGASEGNYTFVVHYADQFEKLLNLLQKAIPSKVKKKAFVFQLILCFYGIWA